MLLGCKNVLTGETTEANMVTTCDPYASTWRKGGGGLCGFDLVLAIATENWNDETTFFLLFGHLKRYFYDFSLSNTCFRHIRKLCALGDLILGQFCLSMGIPRGGFSTFGSAI
jgi:hypothetical protein